MTRPRSNPTGHHRPTKALLYFGISGLFLAQGGYVEQVHVALLALLYAAAGIGLWLIDVRGSFAGWLS